jgi:structural maintenance of chromosome 3 (chondroitin sulfate proteoglycan 6)
VLATALLPLHCDVGFWLLNAPALALALLPAALLQVVVDTDNVGMELVRLLNSNKQKHGRVTFMPLNRLQVPDVAYPRQWGRDVEPLYKYIKCEEKYTKAVQQVRTTLL